MIKITDEDIFKIDEKLAKENVPFHARPIYAAMEILGQKFSIELFNNSTVEEIICIYSKLIPEVKYTWPGMGTGLAASIDQVRKVTIGVAYGNVTLSIHRALGFPNHEEYSKWCRNNRTIAAKSAFAFADMHDLVYGINNSQIEGDTPLFWGLSTEYIKTFSESLSLSGAVGSPILQQICLAVELALKGTLLHLGLTLTDVAKKPFGHNLINLGQKMTQLRSHKDDELVLKALRRFPNLVNERYCETNLSRLEIISLALDAQFISASCVRRITGTDLTSQIEDSDFGSRNNYFK